MSELIKALMAWLEKAVLSLLTRLSELGHPTNASGNNMSQR